MSTNLKVYEETDDKNVDKCVWSGYQIWFDIEYEHHWRNDARFSSAEKYKTVLFNRNLKNNTFHIQTGL